MLKEIVLPPIDMKKFSDQPIDSNLIIMSHDFNVNELVIPFYETNVFDTYEAFYSFQGNTSIIIQEVYNQNNEIRIPIVNDVRRHKGIFTIELNASSNSSQATLLRLNVMVKRSNIDSNSEFLFNHYYKLFEDYKKEIAELNNATQTTIKTQLNQSQDNLQKVTKTLIAINDKVMVVNDTADGFMTDVATKQADVTSKYNAFDTDITEANQTIDELLALQPQFQAVLDETTGKDVISAPEIILARGGSTTLGERLDSDKAEVTAQLSHIVTLDVENFKTETNTYQQAITSALNEVNNASTIQQWKIIFPNKEILVSSSFYLKSNTFIDLNGCILKKASGEDFHVFVTSEPFLENVSILNGTINGNGQNMTGTFNGRFLIIGTPNRNICVDGITVINNRTYTITISESEDITIKNCKFINDDVANKTVALLLYLPLKEGNKRVRVLNNYLYNIAGDNIVVGGAATFKGSDVIIQGNIIEKPCAISEVGVKLGAIQCEGGSAKESIGFENIIISNNIIKEMGAGGSETDGIKVASGKNVIISDNIIVGTSYGIGTSQSENIDIHDNIIETAAKDGIYFTQISKVIKVHDNIIEDPNFNRVGTTAGIRYIVTEGPPYNNVNVIIENNYILLSEKLLQTSYTRGVWVWSPTTLTSNMGNVSIRFNEVVDKTGNNHSYAYKIQNPDFINYIVEGNEHFKTKIQGTATILTGSNTVNVSHGLIITGKPLKYVMVTGGNAETSGVYVLDPAYANGSQIRFRTSESVTVDSTIYWEAEVQF